MTDRQLHLLDPRPCVSERGDADPLQLDPRFDGEAIEPGLDDARLGRQLAGVLAALSRGGWWTLAELTAVAGGSEAGVSARVRDLRKTRFGGHVIERRRRGDPTRGLHEYRLGEQGA